MSGSPPTTSRGSPQRWYYAPEQDKGMPSWERFSALWDLHFGPAVCTSRLSELACLPFHSGVQDYQERFNEMVCHTDGL